MYGYRISRPGHAGAVRLALMPLLLCAAAIAEQGEPNSVALERLLAQNTAAYEDIQSLYVEFTCQRSGAGAHFEGPGGIGMVAGGKRVTDIHSHVWQRGPYYFQDLTMRHTWGDAGKEMDVSQIVVLGKNIFIRLHKAAQVLEVYHFECLDELYPPLDTMIHSWPNPRIQQLAFMPWNMLLEEQYERSLARGVRHWSVKPDESAGDGVFRVQSEDPRGAWPRLVEDFTIDAQRGFLLTEFSGYDRDGVPLLQRHVSLQQTAGGAWFPASATEFTGNRNETAEYQIHEVRVNEDIPDERFTLASMEFDPAFVTMIAFRPGGGPGVQHGYQDGEWLPFDQLPEERVNALSAANREAVEGRSIAPQ